MYKFITFFLFSLLLNNNLSAQETSVYYSFGGILSDIHLSLGEKASEAGIGEQINTGKYNVYNSVGLRYNVLRNLNFELALTYQERLPLEYFNLSGFGTYAYPTSRQSPKWDPDKFVRFPNFNYLHMEVIPMFKITSDVKLSLGIGFFYGVLLNQQELVFDKAFFPVFDSPIGSPFEVRGESSSYRKHDLGLIPKIAVSVPLSDKIELGLSCKSYISQIALSTDNEGGSDALFNMNFNNTWLVFASGLEVSYLLNRKSVEKE